MRKIYSNNELTLKYSNDGWFDKRDCNPNDFSMLNGMYYNKYSYIITYIFDTNYNWCEDRYELVFNLLDIIY